MSNELPDVELSIKFDNEEEMFFTGESVTGFVTSKVNTWMKVSVLKVVLLGAYRLFKKNGSYHYVKIVEETAKLAMNGKVSDIPVGTYDSAFDFKLEHQMPSSIACVAGSVVYKVVARCGYKLSETSDIHTLEAQSYISVSRKVDLRDYPFALVPTRASRRVAPGGYCAFLFFACCGDELQVTLESPCRAYVCGERLVLSATIINQTSHTMTESKIELLQIIKSSFLKKKVSVVRSERGMVLKYSNRVWMNEFLTIPSLPPSTDDPVLQISYKVRIALTRDDDKHANVAIPIIIGNVPLKDDIIESRGTEMSFSYRGRGGEGDAEFEFVPNYLVYRFAETAAAEPSAPELEPEPEEENRQNTSQMTDIPLDPRAP